WSDDHFKCGQRVCDEGASHLFAPSLRECRLRYQQSRHIQSHMAVQALLIARNISLTGHKPTYALFMENTHVNQHQ
ncbi:hypothetical protein ACET98_22790, partial [Aeromonas veronii]